MVKHCIVCGKEFKAPPSSKKITCSSGCSIINKSKTHLGKRNKWNKVSRNNKSSQGKSGNLKLGTSAAMRSPIAGSFETNQNALIWIIKSPEGVTYTVRNLNLWIKNNINLFPGNTVKQVHVGFMQVKRGLIGKSRNSQYKGWQIINWEKPNQ